MATTRVAIVTGSARGIGKAISLRLARDGLDITLNDLSIHSEALEALASEIRSQGRRAIVVVGDISCERDVNNLVETTVKELGGLDVMIANAGIGHAVPLVSTSVGDWDKVLTTNCRGTFLSYKAAATQMIKQGRGGKIIGASSVAGKQGFPDWSAYAASKFAIRGLTQAAAAELGPHGITVNAYAPGIVDTLIFKDIDDHREEKGFGKAALHPDWKVLQPEDVAGLVSYLVRDEAKFITGQSISINGGMYYD